MSGSTDVCPSAVCVSSPSANQGVGFPRPIAPDGRVGRRFAAAAVCLALVLILASAADRRPSHPNAPLILKGTSPAAASRRDSLKLGTFNVHGGRDARRVPTLDLAARTLEDLDFAGLQEVHDRTLTDPRDQSEMLGEKIQAASLFSPTEERWGRDNIGNGIVSRLPVTHWQRIPLEGTQDGRFRNVLLAEIEWNGETVRILVAHIDNLRDHDSQLGKVLQLFRTLREPAVLLGDLNTHASDPQLRTLLADPTVTAAVGERLPHGRRMREVDWIIARGLRCVASETRDLGASDHPAVVAELVLPEIRTAAGPGHSRSGL